jgi:5-methylcytosine-specific restriction endonuclease McrA
MSEIRLDIPVRAIDQYLLTCPICGNTIHIKKSHIYRRKTCSKKCLAIYQKQSCAGEKNGNFRNARKVKNCIICNKPIHYYPSMRNPTCCSKECQAKHYANIYQGEGNPAYNGGINYYGINWRSQKQIALTNAKYQCEYCGKESKSLDVHHIKPFKLFDDFVEANHIDNLVCLCKKCHRIFEGGANKIYNIKFERKCIIAPNCFSPTEAAKQIGCSVWAIYSAIKRGKIKPHNIFEDNEARIRPRYEITQTEIDHLISLRNP